MKGREIYEKLSLAHDIYGKANSIEHSVVKSTTKRIEEIEYTIAHPVPTDDYVEGYHRAIADAEEDVRYQKQLDEAVGKKVKANRILAIPVFIILFVLEIIFFARCHYVLATLGIIASAAVSLLGLFGLLNKRAKNPLLLICRILSILWTAVAAFFAAFTFGISKAPQLQWLIQESFNSGEVKFEFDFTSMNFIYACLIAALATFVMLLILNTRRKAANTEIVFTPNSERLAEADRADKAAAKAHKAHLEQLTADLEKEYAGEMKSLKAKITKAKKEIAALEKEAADAFPVSDDMSNYDSISQLLNACIEHKRRYGEYPPTTYEMWDMYYTLEREKQEAHDRAVKELSDSIYNMFQEAKEREERRMKEAQLQRDIQSVRDELAESNKLQREYNEKLDRLNR